MRDKFKNRKAAQVAQATLNRADSSRINGAKSSGPITEEGKKISSQNGTTHGYYSQNLAVREEHRDEFDRFQSEIQGPLAPRDANEDEIVGRIIAAKWRLRLIGRFESELFNQQMENGFLQQLVEDPKDIPSPYARQAAHVERSLEKALKELQIYRKGGLSVEVEKTGRIQTPQNPTPIASPNSPIQTEPETLLSDHSATPEIQSFSSIQDEPTTVSADCTNLPISPEADQTEVVETRPDLVEEYTNDEANPVPDQTGYMTREEQQAFQKKQEAAYWSKRGLEPVGSAR